MSSPDFENLLKCPICFDYFNVCMLTSCSHNYCSLCIRRYLSYKSQCPLCFEETSEPELQNNRLVDDFVKAYLNRSKGQLSPVSEETEVDSISNRDQSRTNQSTNTEMSSHVLNTSMDDSSEKAPCPVCDLLVKVSSINAHLDMCLNRDERKESLRRPPKKRKKLPKVVYHFLSEKDLKKLLSEAGLNSEGEKTTLVKRHKAYLVLYNSECDSLNPRPVSEIVKQVHDEEKLEERLSAGIKADLNLDKKMNPELIESKQKAYLKKHQTQFAHLVNDIHQRQVKGKVAKVHNEVKASASIVCLDSPSTSKCDANNTDDAMKGKEEAAVVDSIDENSEQIDLDSASEVSSFCETESMAVEKVSSSVEAFKRSDSESDAESIESTNSNTFHSHRNQKLRKTTSSNIKESIPAKRARHPSDEF